MVERGVYVCVCSQACLHALRDPSTHVASANITFVLKQTRFKGYKENTTLIFPLVLLTLTHCLEPFSISDMTPWAGLTPVSTFF